MIQFIHEDIYKNKKEKEPLVNNLLEMTLIYSKNTHIYIYTSDDNPKYFLRIERRRNSVKTPKIPKKLKFLKSYNHINCSH